MRYQKILALLPLLLLCAAPALSQAEVDVSFSVNIAPPALPVIYEQPPLPAPGYLWTPGYWAWDGTDYYWVPGTWVLPPASDLLWTPGYWGWRNGFYGWYPGYWGPEVGFYGGINYGFGYTGVGYQGGYWHGGAFFYNRAVANFGRVNVVNVYSAPVQIHERTRVSFNGGQGGLHWRPNAAERTAMNARHRDPTPMQRDHQDHAANLPALHLSQNHGRPQILTTQRPADFAHPGPGLRDHQRPSAGPHSPAPGSAGPAMRTPNHQESFRRPEQPAGAPHESGGGIPQPRGGPPREGGGNPQPQGGPPHGPGGPPHQQGPRPQGEHQQGRREPEPKHDR